MADLRSRAWPLLLIVALGVAACTAAKPPPLAPPAPPATAPAAAPVVGASNLIDATNLLAPGAGWECVSGARVADGKVVIEADPAPQEATVFINDYRIRLQPREDIRLSLTLEADARPGLAGIKVWNSLPPPQEAHIWYPNSPQLALGVSGGRAYMALHDGSGPKPVFQQSSKPLAPGPVALVLQRSGNALVLRVGDSEEMRTTVLGPFASGPLHLGASVQPGRTLTMHRLEVTEGSPPRPVEVVPALAARVSRGAVPGLRDAPGAGGKIGVFLTANHLRWNEPYREIGGREFGVFSANDGMPWPQLRPARDRFQFCKLDQLVGFAEANGMRVHAGHLSWDSHNPAWLTEGKFSRDELIAILREHIQTVVGRYRGRVHVWNVTNEVFDYNDSGRLRSANTLWSRGIGPEYIDMAFRWAHEADPQAVLLLNEPDAEGLNPKSNAVYELVKAMRARGVPISGVGMQMHWGARQRVSAVSTAADVAANMKRLGDLGLEVYITEMDVPIREPVTPEKLAAQAQTYREIVGVCLDAANCKALIVWGLYDGDSWFREPRFRGLAAPLLFDEAYRPKPAYRAIADLLNER